MFRNNYDNDAVTLYGPNSYPIYPKEAPQELTLALNSSPQGRIFQVEYAQEAVKQGSVVVGLVNKTHVVLVGLKVRASDDRAGRLAGRQRKRTLRGMRTNVGLVLAKRRRTVVVSEEGH